MSPGLRIALAGLDRLRAGAGGNVAVLFAVLLPVIVGGVGLGVETTYWRFTQLKLQAAADAAAYAGSMERRAGSGVETVRTAAELAASQNGFDAASGTLELQAPGTIAGVQTPNAVEVVLRTQAPRAFTAYFVNLPVDIRARAVATFESSSSACILALSPGASSAVLVSGSAQVALQGCSVMANSIAANAVTVQGSASLTAPCIASGGGVQLSGTVNLTECDAALTQAPRAADPYADLAAPTASGACLNANGPTLQPGRYCSGMMLNNTHNLQPGVYVVSGGDFRVNGGGNVTGAGVTIYIQGSGRVRINGNATIQLSAPTSGPYSGILFFGDRANSGGANDFNGSAASQLTGALYFPSQSVNYLGAFSGQGGCTQVVANTVQWSGNSNVGVDCAAYGMSSVPVLGVVKLAE